jgi:hypothetical protein
LYNFSKIGLIRKCGFASFQHYCRDGLGISPRLGQELLSTYRRLFDLPQIKEAYVSGRLSWAKTRLLASISHPSTEAAWLERARAVTVRRLELEVVWSRRLREEDWGEWFRDGGPPPLSFLPPRAEASEVRPGWGLWRPVEEGAHTFSHENPALIPTPCSIRLEVGLETDRQWRRALEISERGAKRRLMSWETLFLILREFLDVWDDPRLARCVTGHATLQRDGWQCAAPGCSSRRGLEVHHIVPRAQGGSSEPSNLITLCSLHHRQIVHRGYMSCRGEAPDRVIFELGLEGENPPREVFRGDVRMRRRPETGRGRETRRL